MGYIDGFEDVMAMETGYLQYTMKLLEKEYADEIRILGIEIPKTEDIPAVRFDEIKKLVSEEYGRKIRSPYDLEPEEEVLISRGRGSADQQIRKGKMGCGFRVRHTLSVKEASVLCDGRSGRSDIYAEF